MVEPEPARHRLVGVVLVLGAATLWAKFGLFAKVLYDAGYSPLEVASLRTWIGLLGAAALALPRPGRLRIARRDIPFYIAYGIGGFALFEVALLATLDRTSVAIAIALLYTAPAFVLVMSRIVWQEAITRTQALALVLVLAGVFLVTGAAPALLAGTAPIGLDVLGLGLAAGFVYGLYTMFSKTAVARGHDAIAALFWTFLFAALALALLAPPLEPALRTPNAWPAMLGIGIVPTLIAYLLYLGGLRTLRASTAAMIASVEPVVAALLAVALLGERPDGWLVAGIVCIAVAAAVLARSPAAAPVTRSSDPAR